MRLRLLRPTSALALAACLHATLVASPAWGQQQPIPLQPSQPTQLQPGPQPLQQQQQPGAQVVPGGDSVFMNNGSVLRGTIVELLPDHVTVQLPTGQLAIIPSKDVHHIERQAAAPGIRPGPAPAVAAQPAGVLVHIDSPTEVNLMRKVGKTYEIACTSPCDAILPTGETYRISASGVASSSDFHLSGGGSRVVLHVDPASSGTKVLGWVLFGVGTATLVAGLTVMLIGALMNTARLTITGSRTASSNDGDPVVAAGGALSLVGLAGLVVGIVLATTTKTKTDQEVQRAASLGNAGDDRWLRVPVWSETAKLSSPKDDAPRFVSVPLLGGTF